LRHRSTVRASRRPALRRLLASGVGTLAAVAVSAPGSERAQGAEPASAAFSVPAGAHVRAAETVDHRAAKDAAQVRGAQVDAAAHRAALARAAAARAARERAVAARERAQRVSRDRQRQALALRDPRSVARELVAARGWGAGQFSCLDSLWTKESGWKLHADNPTSSAFGIPQALPGSKMASAGSDWRTNPVTQIRWGLGYIAGSYGTPCAAWAHSRAYNWY